MTVTKRLRKKGYDLVKAQYGKSGAHLAISDEELFSAMDLSLSGLKQVQKAVKEKDFDKAYKTWGGYWSRRKSPTYYVAPKTYATAIRKHLPELASIIIAQADELWSSDFRHGTYKPERKGRTFQWADNCSDSAYVGLHYFLLINKLGRAYLLTGNKKYPVIFREIVCSWWDAIPEVAVCKPWGIQTIWNNGLGSSLRPVLMVDNYFLMRNSPEFTPELHRKILRIFLGHGRYIFDNHMKSYSHSNFQSSEACWMVTAGVMFPEFKESSNWRRIGIRRVKERIKRNFDKDGAQVEQCPQYHLAGMRDITRAIMLLECNSINDLSADRELWRKLEKIYDYPVRIMHPSGHTALFNSGVYGTEAQAFFPIGVQLFDSNLQKWAVKRYIEPRFIPVSKRVSEYILFMDGAWIKTVNKVKKEQKKEPLFTSELMKDSGIAVLRSGWDKKAFSLAFDFNRKPFGGHAYPGRLSFDLWANGAALVTNPGSTLSYSMPEYGNWCYQTVSHNTVMVNNKSQAQPYFAKLCAWKKGKRSIFVSASTDTYKKNEGIVHQRSIVFVQDEYFFVFDRLTGGKKNTKFTWLLHSPHKLYQRKNGSISTPEGKAGFLIVPDAETVKSSAIKFGKGYGAVPANYHANYKPLEAWREDIPYMYLEKNNDQDSGGQTFGVLLVPFTTKAPEVNVSIMPVKGANPLEVHSVNIAWPKHTDLLSIDYRKRKPSMHIIRLDQSGTELWSE